MPAPTLKSKGLQVVRARARINKILRHGVEYCSINATLQEVELIKSRIISKLYEQYSDVEPGWIKPSDTLPDEFNAYHEAQMKKYGYIKYKIEKDEYIPGFEVSYSVNSMLRYNMCPARNKLNSVGIDEVREWIKRNPVG